MAFVPALPVQTARVPAARAATTTVPLRTLPARPRRAAPAPRPRPPRRAPLAALATGFGISTNPSTPAAVAEAVAAAKQTAPSPTVALVSATVDRDVPQLHAALRDALPRVALHGATTCASVLTTAGPAPNAVAVLLLSSASGLAVASARAAPDGAAAGRAAAHRLAARMGGPQNVRHVLLHATPGLEEAVLHGISEVLGDTPVFGGSAADNTVEGHWRLLSSDEGVFDAGVSLVGVGDPVRFGACLLPPYEPSARSAKITEADGRAIVTLDGRRAGDVLREWVGDSIEEQAAAGGNVIVECAGFPLGIDKGDGAFVGIHAASIDGGSGAVGLFAEANEGEVLTVMDKIGGKDSATAAAIGLERAYEQAVKNGGLGDPKAGVLIYCGGLSIAVGDALGASLDPLKGKPPMLGMTAFGEQGAIEGSNVHSNLAVGIALFE